jgi:hypothetical protein
MGACGSYYDFMWRIQSSSSSEQVAWLHKWSKVDPAHAMKTYKGVELAPLILNIPPHEFQTNN